MDEPRGPSVATETTGRPDADLVLAHLDRLPTLPAIALRLLEVTTDSDSSAADVVALLRGDQSLTAKILSLAGSAWTGRSGPVTTLEKAVPLLGFAAVRSIVLAVSVFECFPSGPGAREQAFEPKEFWKHALAVACAARRLALARPQPGLEPAEAFVAGLLHDIGKVALSSVFPKSYNRIAAQANHSRGDIGDFERSLLGTDHTVCGRRLAERWRLPQTLQEVIWLHHLAGDTLPASLANPQLIGLVLLADTLAREQRIGYSGNHAFYEYSPRLAEQLGFTQAQIDGVVETLLGDVIEYAKLLGLEQEAPDALYARAMTRANAELGRLNTELLISSQRLAAGARYFRAISHFDQLLGAWSDPPAVVAAMARAATVALQRQQVVAFGVRDNLAAVDICWVSDQPGGDGALAQSVPAEIAEWLADPGDSLDAVLTPAPAPLCALLEPALGRQAGGTAWLVPVLHEGKLAGGIVFCCAGDERSRLAGERDDLRSFVASLALALGRANAQVAARHLADDLAEANRRLQQAQVALLRSRTLSMIAEMAAGAGHELNSPLTVISGRAQMLAQALKDPEALRSLELIRNKAHECSQIVSELMDFARPRPPQLTTVQLAELLAEVRTQWLEQSQLPAAQVQLEIETATPGAVPADRPPSLDIEADPDQLATVVRELLANAADAISGTDGVIQVCCRPAVAKGFVEITVRDTGYGMSPATLQRAFDPFYSHRRAGRRRGLGLARAYRITEGHGGRIWLESVPDEGTVAHVLLPQSPPQATPSA